MRSTIMRTEILNRLHRYVFSKFQRRFAWKALPVFIILAWLVKYGIVVIYCTILHNVVFRWTSCRTDQLWPKNFSNIPVSSMNFLIEPSPCHRTNSERHSIDVVVFTPSHVSRFDRRQTIRDTWLKPFVDGRSTIDGKRLITKFLFIVGSLPKYSGDRDVIEKRLNRESATYGDILQLNEVVDDYYNITLKIRGVLNWTMSRCSSADYVIRADSDISLDYVNLIRFLFWLRRIGTGPLVAGYCRQYDCITRWGFSKTCLPWTVYEQLKWSDYYADYFLPRYCFGFSYVLSREFVRRASELWMDRNQRSVPSGARGVLDRYWPLDDAYLTGYLAEAMNVRVPRLNHPNAFNYLLNFDDSPCENGLIASSMYDDDEVTRSRWDARIRRCRRSSES